MTTREQIEKRVAQAASEALYHQRHVSYVDVLLGMGWLQFVHVEDWRKRKIPYLEKAIQVDLGKISYAMNCFRSWAVKYELQPREVTTLAKASGARIELQFSKSGNPQIEKVYRTHYFSLVTLESQQKKLAEKLSQQPDIIVYSILNSAQCAKCDKALPSGSFLFKDADQPLCLPCAGLGGLVFLPKGGQKLTMRAKKYSEKWAVVMKWIRMNKRYERQGILVGSEALQRAQQEVEAGS